MVIDNETGLLVSAGDTDGLADAIDRVIIDLALAKKLGQAGHERAETLFSIQKNVRSLLALFDVNLA
jgi:glycosyltransferase involved in cell wall biosynthesis